MIGTILHLAMAYLRQRPLTTLLNLVLMAIPVAMLVLLLQFGRQAEDRFMAGAQGIDLVVGAKGSPLQLVLSSVYHLDEPTGNIPGSALPFLRAHPMVGSAIPLALGDSFDGYRIVGTQPTLITLYGGSIAEGRVFGSAMEVVLGAEVAQQTGAGIGQRFVGTHGLTSDESQEHDHAPFTVVGILAPTGTPLDRLIVTSLASVWAVHGIAHEEGAHEPENAVEHEHEHEWAGTAMPEITAILVTYRSPAAAVRVPGEVNRNTALQAASPAVESTRLLTLFGSAIDAVRLFGWLLAGAGALAIFVALHNAVRSRIADLALLRVMGAGRGALIAIVLVEGTVTAAVAGLLGVALAHGLLAAAIALHPALVEAGLSARQVYFEEALIVAMAVVLGALAALVPAWTVQRGVLHPIMARG
jgi:putative ABC transport system permease protein